MNPTGSKACQKVRGGDRDPGHFFGNGPQGAEFPLSNKITFAMTLDPTVPLWKIHEDSLHKIVREATDGA